MANPFFSGRIPPGLADKIDAHLLTTGETRSELLIRLLRAEVNDNKSDNVSDNVVNIKDDNVLSDLIARVEKLEQAINNKYDNVVDRMNNNKSDNTFVGLAFQSDDDKSDNIPIDPSSSQDWMNLSTLASILQILPKSISGAASKRGRDLGNDAIEFEVAGKTIQKQGSGVNALYRVL